MISKNLETFEISTYFLFLVERFGRVVDVSSATGLGARTVIGASTVPVAFLRGGIVQA